MTLNEHVALRTPSEPLHATVVVPNGNDVFDGGEHVTVTGGVPPVAVGAGKGTSAVGVPMFASLMSAGQVSVISETGVGAGPVALPQAAHSSHAAATAEPRVLGITMPESW